MNIKLLSRRALLRGALSLTLVGLIAGCGGGNGGPTNDINASQADFTFTNTASTTAIKSPIQIRGAAKIVTASSTGVHAATSGSAQQNNVRGHVLAIEQFGAARRVISLNTQEGAVDGISDPDLNVSIDLDTEENFEVAYAEITAGGNTYWAAQTGKVVVSRVTPTSYTLSFQNVVFKRNVPNNDSFTANGSITVNKADITTESSDTLLDHVYGFGTGADF